MHNPVTLTDEQADRLRDWAGQRAVASKAVYGGLLVSVYIERHDGRVTTIKWDRMPPVGQVEQLDRLELWAVERAPAFVESISKWVPFYGESYMAITGEWIEPAQGRGVFQAMIQNPIFIVHMIHTHSTTVKLPESLTRFLPDLDDVLVQEWAVEPMMILEPGRVWSFIASHHLAAAQHKDVVATGFDLPSMEEGYAAVQFDGPFKTSTDHILIVRSGQSFTPHV